LIGIVHFGVGNIRSVANAVEEVGFDCKILSNPEELADVSHLILPGVGNFAAAAEKLTKFAWREALQVFRKAQKPIFGTCLGMQLMLEKGSEGRVSQGLGWLSGEVVPLQKSKECRVPHVGWNNVSFLRKHPILTGIPAEKDFYFNHSYKVQVTVREAVVGTVEYGQTVIAMLGWKNIFACQFHPEKSQVHGLKIMENFCRWDGKC